MARDNKNNNKQGNQAEKKNTQDNSPKKVDSQKVETKKEVAKALTDNDGSFTESFENKLKEEYGTTKESFIKAYRNKEAENKKINAMSDDQVFEKALEDEGLKKYYEKNINKTEDKPEVKKEDTNKPEAGKPDTKNEKAKESGVKIEDTKKEKAEPDKSEINNSKPSESGIKIEDNKKSEVKIDDDKKEKEPKKDEKKSEKKEEKPDEDKEEKKKKGFWGSIKSFPRKAWGAVKQTPKQAKNLITYPFRTVLGTVKYVTFDWYNYGLGKDQLKSQWGKYKNLWKWDQKKTEKK